MKKLAAFAVLLVLPLQVFAATTESINRRDGFVALWQSLSRPVGAIHTKPYDDVIQGTPGFPEITYAKSRSILGDVTFFHPLQPLSTKDAILWLLKTRNVADPDSVTAESLPAWLKRYPLDVKDADMDKPLTRDALLSLMRAFDELLKQEVHVVSNYGAELQGAGTAFGEKFDMNAMTAAHRYFPSNTLVRVTNVANGKTVTVRINDRGPYVAGRDMDLSAAAFQAIADGATGTLKVRFERLGDAVAVDPCAQAPSYQQPIGKTVLQPGVPRLLHFGDSLRLTASSDFVVRSVLYPDGNKQSPQSWIAPGEAYVFQPAVEGQYVFVFANKDGRSREFAMNVVRCAAAQEASLAH